MSDDILNLVRREIERAMSGRHNKRFGLVTSYDPDKHLAKVTLQPEGQETGWLQIRTSQIGNGWGMVVGLQIDDQVELTPQEGDIETLCITGVVHSEQDTPPRVESGEIMVRHQSGAKIHFDKAGAATIGGGGGGAGIKIDASGNISMGGSGVVNING